MLVSIQCNGGGTEIHVIFSTVLLAAGNCCIKKYLITSRSVTERERRKVKRTLSAIRISVTMLHKLTLPVDIGVYSCWLDLSLSSRRRIVNDSLLTYV
jgi:hypothetical protein